MVIRESRFTRGGLRRSRGEGSIINYELRITNYKLRIACRKRCRYTNCHRIE